MTGRYSADYSPAAERQLRKLDRSVARRIDDAVGELEANPRPPGVKKLTGGPDRYRIRVGDYRVLYSIDDGRLLVLVVAVGHRREVYRRGM